jgi:hypothetical protein
VKIKGSSPCACWNKFRDVRYSFGEHHTRNSLLLVMFLVYDITSSEMEEKSWITAQNNE